MGVGFLLAQRWFLAFATKRNGATTEVSVKLESAFLLPAELGTVETLLPIEPFSPCFGRFLSGFAGKRMIVWF